MSPSCANFSVCGINFADRARKAIVRINGSGIEGEILFFQRDVFRVFVNLTGLTGVLVCMDLCLCVCVCIKCLFVCWLSHFD